MDFNKQLEMALSHKDYELYNEKFQILPIMNVLSFLSPAHAVMYNAFVNYPHCLHTSTDNQLSMIRMSAPKAKCDTRLIWSKYIKKEKSTSEDLKKEEDWLMAVYEVNREVAKMYLKDVNVLEFVKDRVKYN